MQSTPNPLFRLVVVASAAFLITVLTMIVSAFSDSSPIAQWMNRNGVVLIGFEVVAVVLLSVLAMKVDGRRDSEATSDSSAADDTAEAQSPPNHE